jgi:hypothetical protein
MAAITPPLGPEEFLAAPARTGLPGEVTPPFAELVALPETGIWKTGLGLVVGVGIGDDDDDDGIVSDGPVTAGREELGTGSEEDSRGVETPTMAIGEGVSPMLDAGTSVTIGVDTVMPVVRRSTSSTSATSSNS